MMSFRIVAFHYPKTDYRSELLERLERTAEIMTPAAGALDVEVWQEETTGALVSTARFDSRESCLNALRATSIATDIRFDEREERASEIYNLVEPRTP